jgi:alpha-ketoglutaric semialdehyde dehydrogenase
VRAAAGTHLVAGEEVMGRGEEFTGVNPRRGEALAIGYRDATPDLVERAGRMAAEAFTTWRAAPPRDRAMLLRAIAGELEELGDDLLELADAETALGMDRLRGERQRTCHQLRFLAEVVVEGSYLEAIIDRAVAGRPDLRRMLVPIGPVGIFGASNFPLAFSVPGGDTASALAAGCPVIVKAHPSHPGTSELCGRAIANVVTAIGAPPGLFSLLHGAGKAVGEAIVTSPHVAAVAFTGSLAGGRALFDLAARRPHPIPVYAEMGSLNPVFVTPAAMTERSETIAAGLAESVLLGHGQFCTKPGLVFLPEGPGADDFVARLAGLVSAKGSAPMLNAGICRAFSDSLEKLAACPGVRRLAGGSRPDGNGLLAAPALLETPLETFLGKPLLSEEHFGPVAILVRCPVPEGFLRAIQHLPGALAAAIHAGAHEPDLPARLEAALREKAGRLVWDGYPTGVAVTHAMHHGGPYPATTDPTHTSVGRAALRRFLRPVTYQGFPPHLLPPALREDNPLGILRLVDGEWTDAALTSDGSRP